MSFDLAMPAGTTLFGERAANQPPASVPDEPKAPRRTRRSSVPDLPAATVDAAALARALATVKPAADPRHSIAALASGVRIVRDAHGRGWVWRTDLEHACRTQLPLGPGEPFDALVDFAKLAKAAKVLGGLIGIEAVPDGSMTGLRLTAGHRTLQLPGVPGADYPATMPFGEGTIALAAPGMDVHDALSRLVTHTSRDETRPILCHIALDATGHLAATDSYRLLIMPVPGQPRWTEQATLLIPGRTIRASLRDLKNAEQVAITATSGALTIDTGQTQWWARAGQGQYPNYRALLPDAEDASHIIDVDPDELADAASLAVELTDGDSPTVIRLERAGVAICDTGQQPVSYEHALDCHHRGHRPDQPERYGFNPDFLLEAARVLRGQVRLHLTSPLRPGMLTDEHDATVLLMPIRLSA